MYNLTKDGYEAQKKKNGIYIYHSPGCFTCEHHIENFQRFSKEFFLVPTMEDPEFFENDGIRITPTTRLYKNNEKLWEQEGMLFETQLQDLRKIL